MRWVVLITRASAETDGPPRYGSDRTPGSWRVP